MTDAEDSRNIPYNLGDEYEILIFNLLKDCGVVPHGFMRGRAGPGVDAVFIHEGIEHNLEIKKDLFADYGQKMLKWSKKGGWEWRTNDDTNRFYDEIGALDYVRSNAMNPNKHRIPDNMLTLGDKKADQKMFEDTSFTVGSEALSKFYSPKGIHYIQIGDNYGFYHIDLDVAGLGTPAFDGEFTLRFRAKTIHSDPVWKYGFYAVLKVKKSPTQSHYNLESYFAQKRGLPLEFPPIRP